MMMTLDMTNKRPPVDAPLSARHNATEARPPAAKNGANDRATREIDSDAAWRTMSRREGGHDACFVYAVRTTGIYCRPNCPSRRPRRENVTFFASSEEARAAGYRACRRCQPDAPRMVSVDDRVGAARAWIEAHADDVVTLNALARRFGMSPYYLQRRFSEAYGLSPSAYGRALRVDRFKTALKGGAAVSTATYEAGFGSSRAAYEQSGRVLGMTPTAYRAGGRGVDMRYGVTECRFGEALVAETERGVCAVYLGATAKQLEQMLEEEFPMAARRRVDVSALAHAAAVLAMIDGETSATPPLDVAGTSFQTKVWRALQTIPLGETRSYADIARAIGAPKAVRAVAGACAANHVAILIPCHRVITSSGKSGGYRWGAARKRAVLLRERLGGDQRAKLA